MDFSSEGTSPVVRRARLLIEDEVIYLSVCLSATLKIVLGEQSSSPWFKMQSTLQRWQWLT